MKLWSNGQTLESIYAEPDTDIVIYNLFEDIKVLKERLEISDESQHDGIHIRNASIKALEFMLNKQEGL